MEIRSAKSKNMLSIRLNFILAGFFFFMSCSTLPARQVTPGEKNNNTVRPAAEALDKYLPLLKDKRVGLFANHTSVVGNSHLVDTLTSRGIRIVKIFAPEHGFRGTADAGHKISNEVDQKTGIPLISLYGQKRKPSAEDLQDVDILLFDIQDVGVRFYTYISSLEEYMNSAIENNKPLVILDRPNPNGFYIDGPVLEKPFRSFVGMQAVPVVYGMTIGEYALMLQGERWLNEGSNQQLKSGSWDKLTVIPCSNYDHNSRYELPVKPSPNLPDMQSIYLYPSTCFFEGTVLSEGRGTDKPFQVFGHPSLPKNLYSFIPRSMPGATSPKLKDKTCYGWDLSGTTEDVLDKVDDKLQVSWLLEAYRLFPAKDSFFLKNNFFNKLAGNDKLMKQVKDGKSAEEIRASWQNDIEKFRQIRKKYLLYKDF